MKYKVPFVNYPLQYRLLKKEIDRAIFGVLKRGDLILRKDVQDFEKKMARFLKVKYAVGVNSCTDAMLLSLKAAGIGRGDEVITVSHTFFSTIEVIHHCQAKPILVDIREDFLIDPEKIEKTITKRTKAIMPVHLNGRVCEMDKIMEIAKKYNLIVIEDAAQALGAKYKGKMAGSFGLAGCFSFYPAKILGAFGDGGLVGTNEKNLAEKIRLLRDHGRKGKDKIVLYGFTSRLDNLQAAILNVKFKYLTKWIKRRREIAKIYDRGLKEIPQVICPPAPDSEKFHFDVYQNYVIRAKRRDELREFLAKNGVETLIKDPIPNHWQKGLGLEKFKLPNTEKFAKEIISLPIYPELKNWQVEYVIDCIKKFYLK
jgi:dTDP-4-amino-4,6-dideoxygalactose transaminase